MESFVSKFLGTQRIRNLWTHFQNQSNHNLAAEIGPIRLVLAIIIACLPALSHVLTIYSNIDITTVFVGVAAVLAMLFRVKHRIPFNSVTRWTQSLSLTHTAFALGCVPFVIIFATSPESFVHFGQTPTAGAAGTPPPLSKVVFFVTSVSVWAGLTEEIIYRGLLISVIRRASIFKSQKSRDYCAIILSSLIFGLSHYPVWGLPMSLSLVGLGVGFGVAYIAIGELLLPLIVYHIFFDCLSLSFGYLASRI